MEDESQGEHGSIEMDAVTAHLERGWDLLHRGDLAAARVSAHHILKLVSDSPEAHTLLGAIAAADGDAEEALELFRQAMALDPEYLEAILYAAETSIYPLGDHETALELCAEAEDLVLEPDEELDVSLLRAEALCGAGRLDEARGLCAARFPPPETWSDVGQRLRAGRILLDLGQPEAAHALLEHAAKEAERAPDVHYFLAVALEQLGEERRAMEEFLAVLELEAALPAPTSRSDLAEITRQVEAAIEGLPDPLAGLLRGRLVRVVELPAPELCAEGVDPWSTVYLSGLPARAASAEPSEGSGAQVPPRRGKGKATKKVRIAEPPRPAAARNDPAAIVHCVFVYRRNLERVARTAEEAVEELRASLENEARIFLDLGASGAG